MMLPRPTLAAFVSAVTLLHLSAPAQPPCTTQWLPPTLSGANAEVTTLLTLANGDVIAGGTFTSVNGVPCNGIARWNGTTWSAMGAGLGRVESLAQLSTGDIVAGGFFTLPGSVSPTCVARWNGITWLPMGIGLPDTVFALTSLPNGALVAAGVFGFGGGPPSFVARWNGTSWVAMGNGVPGPMVALTTMSNGDVVAGGNSGCYRWDGTSWSLFPSLGPVASLHTLANGDVLVAHTDVIRVDGTGNMQVLGTTDLFGSVYWALELPDGDLLVGGSFATIGGIQAANVAHWNGTAWLPLGNGTNGAVNSLALRQGGEILLGGDFSSAGPYAANRLAEWRTTCPASVAPAGSGCAGSGGANVLVADTAPWTGATMRSTGTGMPGVAVVASVYGFTQLGIPLSSLLLQGAPGCDLLVSPDHSVLGVPIAGIMQSSLAVPDSPALFGLVLFHQLIVFELGAGSTITSVTATNALRLVIGGF